MIRRRKVLWEETWNIIVDFNDVVSNVKKWGERPRQEGSYKDFRNFISKNELVDIGFVGHP